MKLRWTQVVLIFGAGYGFGEGHAYGNPKLYVVGFTMLALVVLGMLRERG